GAVVGAREVTDLGREEDVVARDAAIRRPHRAEERLAAPVAVDVGGVPVGDAGVVGPLDSGARVALVVARPADLHAGVVGVLAAVGPRPEAYHRDLRLRPPESYVSHAFLLRVAGGRHPSGRT